MRPEPASVPAPTAPVTATSPQQQPAADRPRLRVAVLSEAPLSDSRRPAAVVRRTLEHLARNGHDTVLICPGPAPTQYAGAGVVTVPSVAVRGRQVATPSRQVM